MIPYECYPYGPFYNPPCPFYGRFWYAFLIILFILLIIIGGGYCYYRFLS
ncbi:sporulation protein YjcZ [Bacillus alveayuensis]|nr:sporulation protein YjcZ [Bacillus alveayuensis]